MARWIGCLAAVLFLALPEGVAQTRETAPADDTVIVFGRALDLIGEAHSASEGVVGYADFEDRPLSRIGELVEVVPGVIATQHSGEGKANQYFLRGFNLDHGTDFSVSVDGLPVNMRTHGHGQGYLDLNFLIPEIVEQVRYRKGPYFADGGDFSAAGSAAYRTDDRLPQPFLELRVGEFDYVRGVAAGSFDLGPATTLLLAAERQTYGGPWVLDQDLDKLNGFAKLTHRRGAARFDVSLSAYESTWVSTDQIPERAVASGLIDRFGFIDDDLGGGTRRFSLNAGMAIDHADGASTTLRAYLVDYDFTLYSNFTYFLEDPVNGDEFEQRDDRTLLGGSLTHARRLSETVALRAGADLRRDDISDVGLFRIAARQRVSTVREDAVEQTSLDAWAEAEVRLSESLRATLGLRADHFDVDVTAISTPANGGSADDSLLSPSAALAWRLSPAVELYANYGQGFHSNDGRGATITIDPVSGDPVERTPLLVRAEGAELGGRIERPRWNAAVAAFWLTLDSELVFVGDGGSTEPNDATERFGVEANAFWTPTDWLTFDASAAWTDAQFDIAGAATEIPGAVESVFAAGALVRLDPATFSIRVRHFSEAPLIEDGSVTSDPTTIFNTAATWDAGPATFSIEILNLFDAEDADITYFYESRVAGEPAGVEDRHFHPIEPRQLRVGVRYRF
ncbi:TonB-dependent receptor [bacterium]|nr:TonB-dependent receptor [bacterium]